MAGTNVVEKPSDIWKIIYKEEDSQNEAVHATDTATRKKFGPAAGHFGGNVTEGGGINRPTKGRA